VISSTAPHFFQMVSFIFYFSRVLKTTKYLTQLRSILSSLDGNKKEKIRKYQWFSFPFGEISPSPIWRIPQQPQLGVLHSLFMSILIQRNLCLFHIFEKFSQYTTQTKTYLSVVPKRLYFYSLNSFVTRDFSSTVATVVKFDHLFFGTWLWTMSLSCKNSDKAEGVKVI